MVYVLQIISVGIMLMGWVMYSYAGVRESFGAGVISMAGILFTIFTYNGFLPLGVAILIGLLFIATWKGRLRTKKSRLTSEEEMFVRMHSLEG